MATPTAYTGHIVKGKFIPDNPAAFVKAFLRKDGTRMEVTAKKVVPRRSDNTNRYWFGVVVPLFMDELGERDKYVAHHIILEAIGHYDELEMKGRRFKIVRETRDLAADDFSKLIEGAGQLFAEWFGGYIPPPDSAQARAMIGGS
jgi:hypothetical protein